MDAAPDAMSTLENTFLSVHVVVRVLFTQQPKKKLFSKCQSDGIGIKKNIVNNFEYFFCVSTRITRDDGGGGGGQVMSTHLHVDIEEPERTRKLIR